MTPLEVLTQLGEAHFSSVVAASPRKFREEVFRRAGVKNPRGGAFGVARNKNAVRTRKLFEAVQGGAQIPDELVEEMIRNYLYGKRELLAAALDFFEVEHDHGLTDAELDFIQELEPAKGDALKKLLLDGHAPEDVELYMRFMSVPHTAS